MEITNTRDPLLANQQRRLFIHRIVCTLFCLIKSSGHTQYKLHTFDEYGNKGNQSKQNAKFEC